MVHSLNLKSLGTNSFKQSNLVKTMILRWAVKEEIRKEKDERTGGIDETNEKMRQEQFHMSCPVLWK